MAVTDSSSLFVSFSIVIVSATLWYLWRSKQNKGEAPLPPGPRGLPVVGYLPFLDSELHTQFTQMSKVYGPVFKLWFGSKLCVVLNTPAVVKEALKDHDVTFANHDVPQTAYALYDGKGITWSPHGEHWRSLRKVFVRELMSNSSLDAYSFYRQREMREMVKDVYARKGTEINLGELAFITALNAVTSFLWGGSMNGEERRKVGVEFRDLMEGLVVLLGKPNVSEFFPVLARFDLQGLVLGMKKIVDRMDVYFDAVIEQNKNADSEHPHLLKLLLQLTKTGEMTRTYIKALFLDVMIGGTDTTSTTVEWAMSEIIYNPRIMKKVQQELDEVVGPNNIVEEHHIPKLHYLEAVFKEVERRHPPVPFLAPYKPSESRVIGGYLIPKDTKVMVNVCALHRNPENWKDPLEFKPERFLEDSNKMDFRGQDFRYIPFGAGRRICAGISMAERVLMLLLASLLHSFDWHLPKGAKVDVSEKFTLVLKKEDPLLAIPTPRLPSQELYQ